MQYVIVAGTTKNESVADQANRKKRENLSTTRVLQALPGPGHPTYPHPPRYPPSRRLAPPAASARPPSSWLGRWSGAASGWRRNSRPARRRPSPPRQRRRPRRRRKKTRTAPTCSAGSSLPLRVAAEEDGAGEAGRLAPEISVSVPKWCFFCEARGACWTGGGRGPAMTFKAALPLVPRPEDDTSILFLLSIV